MSKKIMIDTSEILENTEGQADAETLKANIEEITKVIEESKRILSELYEMAGMAQEEDEDIKGLASLQLFADPEEKEEAAGEKPKRRPPLPTIKNYALMNDKVTNVLSKTDAPFFIDNNGNLELICKVKQGENPTTKEPIIAGIALTYEGSQRINAFDLSVCSAVATCYHFWQQINGNTPMPITVNEIWQIMNGKTNAQTLSKAQEMKVKSSMDKMRLTLFRMDTSEELKHKYLSINDERIVNKLSESYFINAKKDLFISEKGKIYPAYTVFEEPILYTYNKLKKHLLLFDYSILDTSDETSNTENVVCFRNYMILQILMMKSKERHSNRMLFSTIYECTGIEEPEKRIKIDQCKSESAYKTKIKKEAKKDRDKIFAILDSWVGKGFINGYEPIKKGRNIRGVEIAIAESSKKAASE